MYEILPKTHFVNFTEMPNWNLSRLVAEQEDAHWWCHRTILDFLIDWMIFIVLNDFWNENKFIESRYRHIRTTISEINLHTKKTLNGGIAILGWRYLHTKNVLNEDIAILGWQYLKTIFKRKNNNKVHESTENSTLRLATSSYHTKFVTSKKSKKYDSKAREAPYLEDHWRILILLSHFLQIPQSWNINTSRMIIATNRQEKSRVNGSEFKHQINNYQLFNY